MAVLTAGAAGTRAGAARRVRGRGYLPGYRVICCTGAVAHGRGRSFPVSAQLAGRDRSPPRGRDRERLPGMLVPAVSRRRQRPRR